METNTIKELNETGTTNDSTIPLKSTQIYIIEAILNLYQSNKETVNFNYSVLDDTLGGLKPKTIATIFINSLENKNLLTSCQIEMAYTEIMYNVIRLLKQLGVDEEEIRNMFENFI